MHNTKRLIILTLMMIFGMVMTFDVQAQTATPSFAAVNSGVLTIYNGSAAPIAVSNPTNRGFSSPTWSPDGSKLAYLIMDDTYQMHLMVTDASGSAPITLETGNLESGFPISFTPDGSILYAASGTFNAADNKYTVTFQTIAPEAGAKPQTLGTAVMQVGCGGGSPLPADGRYWEETGFGGSYLTLAMTDAGLLHSTSCAGVGLSLLDLKTGTDTVIGPDMATQQGPTEGYGRAVLSPDGKQLAALYTHYSEPTVTRTLAVIDLATLSAVDVTTTAQPDQIAWGRDGSLFYSSITTQANLTANLSDAEKQNLSNANLSDMEIDSKTLQIHEVSATGQDQVIYSSDGYAIGRMALADDGMTLVFSQIANLDAWVKAITDGTLNPMNDPNGDAQRALVPVSLYQVTLAGGANPVLIGDNLAQVVLRPGSGP
jgi:WD40 repeat protein